MKPKVLITAPYMHREKKKIMEMLKDFSFDVAWLPVEERLSEADLLPVISEYQGILCGDDEITKKVIDGAKNLKAIVKWGTGIDSIDKDYAESKEITVHRTVNAFTEPVSDTTIGLMLNEVRGLIRNDRVFKEGYWDKPQGYTLREKTIGIIGFGNIGKAVARKLIPFGPKVLVHDKNPKVVTSDTLKSLNVKSASRDEIYKTCDIITVHCDLDSDSKYLLNSDAFSKMKRKPYIINTSRGLIIKEKDLIGALEQGLISGVGIDVFEKEPLAKGNPLGLMDAVVASCHNSNSSPTAWDAVHKNSLKMMAKGLGIE